jgi:DNA-binding NarL/FixJ family response regulator
MEGVMRGEIVIARELSEILWKEVANQRDTRLAIRNHSEEVKLTARQIEILLLVAQGLQNKEIAETLCVSEHTIKYHMSEILQRLQVKNRDQAVAYALNNGLIR